MINLFRVGLPCAAALALPTLAAQEREALEHFEKHIRPLLVEHCYACHSADTQAMGDLLLDTRDGWMRGGSRGPALVPGDPSSSLLLEAVSYGSLALRMPPTGRLPDESIAHLETWIRLGAHDPRDASVSMPDQEEGIDLEAGRQFWSFLPVLDPAPPAVEDDAWARTIIDRFVLAHMAAENLKPAPQTDRMTLLRRVAFDLTGLPPTRDDVERFLRDPSEDAFPKAVDRLLASPHYGERWARHWLDLVRWAETNGHEFDNNKLDAWRYRDYVVDAFNADLPYNVFLREQIAGDLLPARLSTDGTHLASPIASGVHWLWEVLNSPTDSVKARADQIDNQIDVLTKATQGLTVACARCHDHKFDPIPTADYYSLFGILQSTHMSEICIDSPEREREIHAAAAAIGSVNQELRYALRPVTQRLSSTLAERLLAASAELPDNAASPLAKELKIARSEPSHPLHPFALALAADEAKPFGETMQGIRGEMEGWSAKAEPTHPIWEERGDTVYEDFADGFGLWNATGAAFGQGPVAATPPGLRFAGYAGETVAASHGTGAKTFVGTLTTEKFRMPARFVHVRMAGESYSTRQRENAALRFTVIADEHKSGHAMPSGEGMRWHTIAMTKERGRICSIEIIDRDRAGSIAVDRVVFSRSKEPPPIAGPIDPRILALVRDPSIQSLEDLAGSYQALADSLAAQPDPSFRDVAVLAALTAGPRPITEDWSEDQPWERDLHALVERRNAAAEALPTSSFGMSSRDWKAADSPIHLRGNHENLGENAPRQFLQVIAGVDQEPFRDGSGRVALADWIASERNPLTARVMVNRIWHHHFGRGIVPSTDDFGRMGEMPTHPALLDHMASRFMASNWSIKDLQRDIVLSSTYRMSSARSEMAAERDPDNRLLSHFPVRRLEAEAIRDAVLAVSGTLDTAVGGPGVVPHISEFQDGRGKPTSGPLDGQGRRSIYTQVRRNFLPPMFLAFDYPLPISTAGRRGVSTVASQALLMLNNELVHSQAVLWADRVRKLHGTSAERIRTLYMEAFGRPPQPDEIQQIEAFVASRSNTDEGDPAAWADAAHALLNTSEFLFVR